MDNLNYIFFEQFKRLDNLCADIFDSHPGVTAYIDHMEATPSAAARVAGWPEDLRQLKHLRHIRNHLAHDSGAFLEENCTQADIDWLDDFYNRIIKRSDPIALARQQARSSSAHRQTPSSAKAPHTPNASPKKQKKKFYWAILILLLGLLAFLFASKFIL